MRVVVIIRKKSEFISEFLQNLILIICNPKVFKMFQDWVTVIKKMAAGFIEIIAFGPFSSNSYSPLIFFVRDMRYIS
jgi:hypothetical protein